MTQDMWYNYRMANSQTNQYKTGFLRDGSLCFYGFRQAPISNRIIENCYRTLPFFFPRIPLPRLNTNIMNPIKSFKIGKIPAQGVYKLCSRINADSLLQRGSIRLGSVAYYSKFDHAQIGDETEGFSIIAAYSGSQTHIHLIKSGLNDRLFCCFAGLPSRRLLSRFGYDAVVRITDVDAFSKTVAAKLDTDFALYAKCVYARYRAIYGEADPSQEPWTLSSKTADILGTGIAFIKSKNYSHQNEFRFLWRMPARVDSTHDIECPEIARYCERVDLSTLPKY